jgi:Zn-dependent M28 family amino/carboxypeptidase
VLAARPQPATIHFAFLTAEEAGLLGAREYTRIALERGDAVVGFVNNDMIGFANDQRLDNTIRYTNAGIRDVQHAAALLFTDLITYDTRYYRGTDAHALFDAFGDVGGGIGSYPILGNPHYHTSHDVLETINHQLVTEVARATAATLLQLTNVPSRPVLVKAALRDAGTVDVSWRTAPESDVVGWDVDLVGADGSTKRTQRVQTASVTLRGVVEGDAVEVRAVNRRGARSWDALRVTDETAALAEQPAEGL